MVILKLKLLCLVLNILGEAHGLGLGQLLGGLKDSSSKPGANDMILCTVRHNVHYATIYDSVLVNKVEIKYWYWKYDWIFYDE